MAERGVTMQAGMLDRRIEIQYPVVTRNAVRDEVTAWQPWASLPAHYEPGVGKEDFEGKQLVGQSRVAFIVRGVRQSAPKPAKPSRLMRVIYDGGVYGIEDVQEIGRGPAYWRLLAVLKDNEKP